MPMRQLYVILTPPGPTVEFIELEDSEGQGVGDVPMVLDPRSSSQARDYYRLGPFVSIDHSAPYLKPVLADPEKPPISAADYDAAIQALHDARTQLWPDGRNCAICTDSGHQAWECRFNPLVLARSFQRVESKAEELHELLHRTLGL